MSGLKKKFEAKIKLYGAYMIYEDIAGVPKVGTNSMQTNCIQNPLKIININLVVRWWYLFQEQL